MVEIGEVPARARAWWWIPLYPVWLAMGIVVLLMVTSGISPFAAVRTLAVTAVVATLLVLLGTALLGDPYRGGVFGTLAIVGVMGGDTRLVVLVVIALVLMFIQRFAIPAERQTIRWSRIGTITSRLVLIFLLAIGIKALQAGEFGLVGRALVMETALQPGPQPVLNASDPDIYMILLDGHTRLDVAQDMFDVDPAPLRDGLTRRGFSIADRSRSNYTLTSETLSSMFEQAHAAEIPRLSGLIAGTEDRPAGAIVESVINDNLTFSALRARGYEIEAISSGFMQVSVRESDRFVDTGQLSEFEIAMLRRPILDDLLMLIAPDATSAQQRDRIRGVFDALSAAPDRATVRPTFVFAHVPSPHAPWVFHADGSPRTADLSGFYQETPASTGVTVEELSRGYSGQLVDIDRRLLETLDRLDLAIAARGRPAVTIVFSDHGTWIGADGGDTRLRFKNLLAVRGDGLPLTVQPDLTLVNLMPSLFEQLYGTPWVRRADTTYMFGPRDDYDFHPVDDPDARPSP